MTGNTEALAHPLGDWNNLLPMEAMLANAGSLLGFPAEPLALAARLCESADDYPFLGSGLEDQVKVYLDLKDWVALAKARLGRPGHPEDQSAYELLQGATQRGDVVVPLTLTTYMEVTKIASLRQRTDLADVIAEISGFVTITGLSILFEHQLRTALATHFDVPPPAPIDVFGIGVLFAGGKPAKFALTGHGSAEAAPALPAKAVRAIETISRVGGEYMMLRGPDPEELDDLRSRGYRPEAVEEPEQQRVAHERDLAEKLRNGDASRGRLADFVHARYLYWELNHHLYAGLRHYGIDDESFFGRGKQWVITFLDDIPSAAVATTLTERIFRNADKTWTGNDVRDGDAMCVAIPYCDIVMSDKFVAAQLRTSPAVERLGTLVLPRLRDLNEVLPGLITERRTLGGGPRRRRARGRAPSN